MELTLAWCLCFASIYGIVKMSYTIVKKKKKRLILPLIVLFFFFGYSFLTTKGSIRLSIALLGHPIDAYTTDFVERPTEYDPTIVLLKPTKDIQMVTGSMLYLQCKSYGLLKISNYYGF